MKIKKTFIIKNNEGLHARPLAKINEFILLILSENKGTKIYFKNNNNKINAQFMVDLLLFTLEKDDVFTIIIKSKNSEQIYQKLSNFFKKINIYELN